VLATAAGTVGAATVINAAVVGFIQLLLKEYSFSRQTIAVGVCSGKLRGVRLVRRIRDKAGEIDLLLSFHSFSMDSNVYSSPTSFPPTSFTVSPALVLIEDYILSDLPAIGSGKLAESAAGFPDLVRKLLPP
jgi:hypothetical protein